MKILFIGGLYSAIGGQARVARGVIPELQKLGYEVVNAGKGTQILDPGEKLPCLCYEFSEHEPAKLYQIIDQVKPDVILFSHDIWTYYFIPELKQKYPQIKLVGWWTIDASPIHNSWFGLLRTTDYNCVSTEFGRKTIYQRFPEKMCEVVKYGVDRNVYNLT